MMCGFSGLPKLRQLVAPTGVAPAHATLRQASATACIAPSRGSRLHQRPLPSSAIASPRCEPLMRITPASPAPGDTTVLVCTIWSYCCHTQRLLQILGLASSRLSAGVKSRVNELWADAL